MRARSERNLAWSPVNENILPIVAAGDHMMKPTLDLDPCLSLHISGILQHFICTLRKISAVTQA